MDTGISAIQHLRPLRGGAQAHLLKASDGSCYVPNVARPTPAGQSSPHFRDWPNVGPLSEGFERSVASPLQPRRLCAMGRTV